MTRACAIGLARESAREAGRAHPSGGGWLVLLLGSHWSLAVYLVARLLDCPARALNNRQRNQQAAAVAQCGVGLRHKGGARAQPAAAPSS